MEYLKAAISLVDFIKTCNTELLPALSKVVKSPNQMWIKSENSTRHLMMEAFSNDFVLSALKSTNASQSFVITDVATMDVQGKTLTYILYKGYHKDIEKGLVFYQVINTQTFEPMGEIQFSNMEDNIFYQVDMPASEESSCNAMETDEVIENGKSIVFFIGHMDEQRLAYDIERLVFDTANNVTKHQKLAFKFAIHIAHYGGTPSDKLKSKVNEIDAFTREFVKPHYPNATFAFSYEQDGSMN